MGTQPSPDADGGEQDQGERPVPDADPHQRRDEPCEQAQGQPDDGQPEGNPQPLLVDEAAVDDGDDGLGAGADAGSLGHGLHAAPPGSARSASACRAAAATARASSARPGSAVAVAIRSNRSALPASHGLSAAGSVGGGSERSSREMSTAIGTGPSRSSGGTGAVVIGHRPRDATGTCCAG